MTPPRPRAERRLLQQIIAGLTEGIVLIDTDGAIVWANEAALSMHGVASFDQLGTTIEEYRDRFALRYRNRRGVEPGSYPMDRVLAGENFDDVFVEVVGEDGGPRWVHRIRGLVLTDSEGVAELHALVLHDATERFNAEERFERTFNANPAPAVIFRLSDRTAVKVNQGFTDLAGYARADVLGRSLGDLDIFERAEQRDLAFERLAAGRTIPQMETLLGCAGGKAKWAIVAGQPIDYIDEPCMLLTFMDLDPRKQAETALRQSEERFAKSFRLSPVPTLIATRDGFRILDVNGAFSAVLGHAAETAIGRTAAELGLWSGKAGLDSKGGIRDLDLPVRRADGAVLDCLVSADIVTIGTEDCVLATIQDITARRRGERELMEAIEAVMQDTSWFSRTVIEKLANLRENPGGRPAGDALAALTIREREVLGLICEGLSDAAIAAELGLSRNTVRNQVAAIYAKTDIHRRPALIVWARERGITARPIRPRKPVKKH